MRLKLPSHGRNHRIGGSDPIPGLEGWRFNVDNEGGWGYVQFNDSFDMDFLPDPLAVGGDWGAVFQEVSGDGLLIGTTTFLDFIAQNFAMSMRSDGAQFAIVDRFGSQIVTYTGIGLGSRSIVYGGSVAIDMGANKITNVTDPTANQDAATKKYVDDHTGSPSGSAGGVLDGTYPNPGLAASVAGGGLAETSDVLSVNVDGSTLEISSDALRVKDGGITTAKLSFDPATQTELDNHINDTTDAHDASAISIVDSTDYYTSTDVEGALAEIGAGLTGVPTLPPGASELIYRYTVTGSDKASIDTGADTADAGSNDWTGGDLLEVFILMRTDDAAARVNSVVITVNNDTGSNYDFQQTAGVNTAASAGQTLAAASWDSTLDNHGAGGSASYPTALTMTFPNYAGTTFFKTGTLMTATLDATAGNNSVRSVALGYRSTSALTRLKLAAAAGQKLKVGSQLLIYKRRAS